MVIKSISNIQDEVKQCTEREKSALELNQKLVGDKLIYEECIKMLQDQTANASQKANGHKERHASNLVFLIGTDHRYQAATNGNMTQGSPRML